MRGVRPQAQGCWPWPDRVTGPGLAAFRSPESYTLEYRLRRRGPESNRAVGRPRDGAPVGFRPGWLPADAAQTGVL